MVSVTSDHFADDEVHGNILGDVEAVLGLGEGGLVVVHVHDVDLDAGDVAQLRDALVADLDLECHRENLFPIKLLFEEQYSAIWQNSYIFLRVGITFNDRVGETTIFALVHITGIQWQYLAVLGQAFVHVNFIKFLFKFRLIVVGVLDNDA